MSQEIDELKRMIDNLDGRLRRLEANVDQLGSWVTTLNPSINLAPQTIVSNPLP